ncbi:hypothetical protein [Euzebya tangerina]|uniref:hypothetical protein n=1 Tax=Euzebya tangerina TaxID=591198 RepID=UPI0013C331A3|nr:hypothetical protein [Euzebya tangerina]
MSPPESPTPSDIPPGTDDWPVSARRYLAEVEQLLSHLDQEERDELREDLVAHIDALLEVEEMAHGVGDHVSLSRHLGTPEAFAAELLLSAGVPPSSGDRTSGPGIRARLATIWRAADAALSRTARLRTWAAQLKPAWWVARGYGLTIGVGAITSFAATVALVPNVFGSPLLGLLVTAALVYASVEIGSGRRAPATRWQRIGVGVLSAAAGWSLLLFAVDRPAMVPMDEAVFVDPLPPEPPEVLTMPDGQPVTNIYAFDREGNALDGVLLYDGVGNPITLQIAPDGDDHPFDTFGVSTDYERDERGRVIPNLYPLDQFTVDPALLPQVEDSVAPVVQQPFGPEATGGMGDERERPIGPRPVPDVVVPDLDSDRSGNDQDE